MPEIHIIVKLDFSYAFNALRRDSMLEAVAAKAPEIYRYVFDNYAYTPQLQTRQHTILSEEGTQQGDPLIRTTGVLPGDTSASREFDNSIDYRIYGRYYSCWTD